jgi:hypothetical protein
MTLPLMLSWLMLNSLSTGAALPYPVIILASSDNCDIVLLVLCAKIMGASYNKMFRRKFVLPSNEAALKLREPHF